MLEISTHSIVLTSAVNAMNMLSNTLSGICVAVPIDTWGVFSLYLHMMGNSCATHQLSLYFNASSSLEITLLTNICMPKKVQMKASLNKAPALYNFALG